MSHQLETFLFCFSDHHETLYPMTLNEKNEGGTNLLTKNLMENGNYDKSKISAPPVDTVTTLEILKWINTKQIIMKIDIEGFECKVIYNVFLLFYPINPRSTRLWAQCLYELP